MDYVTMNVSVRVYMQTIKPIKVNDNDDNDKTE